MSITKLKWTALAAFGVAMAVLLGGGYFAVDKMPPYPGQVQDATGWELRISDDLAETPSPSADELDVLRAGDFKAVVAYVILVFGKLIIACLPCNRRFN